MLQMYTIKQITSTFMSKISLFSLPYRVQSTNQRNVVVTGIGIVSPLGCKADYVWAQLLNGKCGISEQRYKDYDFPSKVAATVPRGSDSFQFSGSFGRESSLAAAFAIAAADEAMDDSQWNPETEKDRENTGIAVGIGVVDIEHVISSAEKFKSLGYRGVSPYFVPRLVLNMPAGIISIKYKLRGPNHCVSTACTTGSHAIGDAFRFITNGDCDVMLAGSADTATTPLVFGGFCKARALTTKFNEVPEESSRPFHSERDGFVLGEGAAMLVLEEENHALRRGARIYARILGYGLSADATHITAPHPEGKGAAMSMRAAIRDSGIDMSDVTYINAHATSTPLGDAAENKAIKTLFGEHAYNLAVSSTKGAVGHLLGAAGSIEAAFTVLACYHGELPPTLNLDRTDPDMDLNYVPMVKQTWKCSSERRVGLSNSFGFGGTNATLCISSY